MFDAMLSCFNGIEIEFYDMGRLPAHCNTMRKMIDFAKVQAEKLDRSFTNIRLFDNIGLIATCSLLDGSATVFHAVLNLDTEIIVESSVTGDDYTIDCCMIAADEKEILLSVNISEVSFVSSVKKLMIENEGFKLRFMRSDAINFELIGLL